MPVSLTRTRGFFALHRFFDPDRSDAENLAAFGALAARPGHGHDYRCAVTVAGPYDAARGTLVDLAALDRLLDEEVGTLDGTNLATHPAFASGRPIATCEALAVHLFGRIAGRLPAGLTLERVRITEDPSLWADCTGAP